MRLRRDARNLRSYCKKFNPKQELTLDKKKQPKSRHLVLYHIAHRAPKTLPRALTNGMKDLMLVLTIRHPMVNTHAMAWHLSHVRETDQVILVSIVVREDA
jgi:hypothetical protein